MPIQGGRYRVAGNLLVGGTPIPWYSMSVDINAYSMSSMIEAHAPIFALDGKTDPKAVPDYGAMTQQGLVTLGVQLGYAPISGSQPLQMFDVERGYIDEMTDRYGANEISFTGRSTASVFQDARIAKPGQPNRNQRGDQLASSLFAKRSIPLTVGASSPHFVGKAYTDESYTKAMRARSEWDEMTDAALADGFILSVHNGQGYYGPPASDASLPTVKLAWGSDLTECVVNHAARRSHTIKVRVDSYVKETQAKVSATYGFGGGPDSDTYRFFVSGLDRNKTRVKAKAIWTDLVKREFIATMSLVPDVAMLQAIAKYGSNFLVQLSGCKPSANLLYHVKQARLSVTGGDTSSPSALVDLICENHAPVQGAGAYV